MGNKTEKQKIGELGESLACRYLIKKGFEIMDRNYRKPWGEIDIVAQNGKKVVFVEVKTVTSHFPDVFTGNMVRNVTHVTKDEYRPEDNVHAWKLERLSRVIRTYLLYKYKNREPGWQFDVITVVLDQKTKKAKIKHLEDIIL